MLVEKRASCIVIHDYELGDSKYIEKIFSVYDKLTHKFNLYGMYYDEANKKLYLPNGLDDYYLFKGLGHINNVNTANNYDKVDEYEAIDKVRLRTEPRDETQITAIQFCIGHGKYSDNKYKHQICLNLNTGKGKTYVAITVFAIYSIKTMMITSNIDWINQWKDRILEYTDLKPDDIYIVSGLLSIHKLKNGFYKDRNFKFFLCSHDTLNSYAKKYGWEELHKLFIFLKIGVKIYDEAHLYFNNILMIDFYTNTWKTYYLTATPDKSDRFENRVYKTAFYTIPKIDLFNPESDPHTKYIAVMFNSHPTAVDVSRAKNPYGFDRNKYIDYLVTRPNYFKIAQIVIDNALKSTTPNGKILVYIGTNRAIMITYNYLKYIFRGIPIGIFSSLISKEQKKQELNNKIILTTTKSAGAALDIHGLEVTIILNEPFNSPVLARQTLGRTRANNTLYIDVVDTGFRTLMIYYRNKQKIFNRYSTGCEIISYDDYMLDQYIDSMYQEQIKIQKELEQSNQLTQVVTFTK